MYTEKNTTQNLSDQEFMAQIYRDYNRLMFYIVKQHVNDPRHWDDIIQDSLTRLIGKVSTLRTCNEKALASYVSITVRNTAFNYLRRQQKEQNEVISIATADNMILDDGQTLDEYLISNEKLEQLSKLWPSVDAEARQLLEGKYILGYDDRQLASMLGCQPNSVRMKLTRARRKALKILREGDLDD